MIDVDNTVGNAKAQDGYLVTFTDAQASQRVSGDTIYNELVAQLADMSDAVFTWHRRAIFFYRNTAGIVGHGIVLSSGAIEEEDSRLCTRLASADFALKSLWETGKHSNSG